MQMRIVWGKVLPGQWAGFESAVNAACTLRGEINGLKRQWLVRDQNDPDAGFSIQLWESDEEMHAYWRSEKHLEAKALLVPFYANQYTVTHCDVKLAVQYP
jgi:heme-degrading monooxygenase HmoA